MLGEGDNSVGDLLPGYFAQAGLIDIQTFLNDKAFALVPPYVSPAQQALRTAMLEDAESNRWLGWPASDAKRYYLAGGGIGTSLRLDGSDVYAKLAKPCAS